MTIAQRIKAFLVIRQVAKHHGISTSQCRREISEAIREAWRTTDPVIRQRQTDLAGKGRIPSPEEFILLLSSQLGSAHRVAHTAGAWTTPMDR